MYSDTTAQGRGLSEISHAIPVGSPTFAAKEACTHTSKIHAAPLTKLLGKKKRERASHGSTCAIPYNNTRRSSFKDVRKVRSTEK